MKKNPHLENTEMLVAIDDRGITFAEIDLQWVCLQNTHAVYIHGHVHFQDTHFKIGSSVIDMLQGLLHAIWHVMH